MVGWPWVSLVATLGPFWPLACLVSGGVGSMGGPYRRDPHGNLGYSWAGPAYAALGHEVGS